MRKLLFLLGTLICIGPALAQQTNGTAAEPQKRIVYFKDKANSPYSLQQPLQFLSQKAIDRRTRQQIALTTRDLPVNPAYVAGLKQLEGVTVWYTSRWFNAAVVQCTDAKLAEIQALDFVKTSGSLNRIGTLPQAATVPVVEPLQQTAAVMDAPYSQAAYGQAFNQANMIGAVDLHNKGFTGQNMTIAVLDAGFPGVNTIPAFAHLFQNNKIKGTFDFVKKQENVYAEYSHGTSVLSTMAAYQPNQYIGTAFGANFILLRTEDVASEHKIEEINWLLAAEYADSAGADVLNSSIGYTTFQAPSPSYTYNNLDGNTALVTKAADYAAATGMLVVVSAGNDGAREWRYIATPADADSVLTVGSVDKDGIRAASSSVGPTADGRIKPDVMAQGQGAFVYGSAGNIAAGTGTSFSAPIVAGLAAILWEANSTKTSQEIIRMIRQSGSLAVNPTNEMGYGIPNASRIVTSLPQFVENDLFITNPVSSQPVLLTLGEKWVKQESTVQVYDITGRLIYQAVLPSQQYSHQLELQPQVLKQGVYFCRISSGKHISTLRFLKL
ncbi:S8 family serine peptidase [Botryobacter ruber]|uniref:S8 family serine peptidase n=1 Tax=Botryobacter ruber TaxID=2171629 RepID=UPI000E0C647A|nr:S8 family serine peptidase [Botryobacter ruber]